jgi:hypothetical protein
MSKTDTLGRTATAVCTVAGVTHVTYHKTAVVSYTAERVTLRTGGWRTATTKLRMNQASNQFGLGFTVTQKAGEWFVHLRNVGKVLTFGSADEISFPR